MSQIPDADSFAFTLPLRKLTKAVVITSYGMPSEDALVVKGWRFAAKHFGLAHKMIVSTVFFAFSDFNAEYSGYCQARAIAGNCQARAADRPASFKMRTPRLELRTL